jgi:hypothetical protein
MGSWCHGVPERRVQHRVETPDHSDGASGKMPDACTIIGVTLALLAAIAAVMVPG